MGIYARSFAQLGIDRALDRLERNLLAASPGATSLMMPCFLRGDTQTTIVEGRRVSFVGTGDAESCALEIKKLQHPEYECVLPPCSMMGIYMAPVRGQFYAINAYFYTVMSLGIVGRNSATIV